jgi:hypothetical protein
MNAAPGLGATMLANSSVPKINVRSARCFSMTTIVQVEYRPSLLSTRGAILQSLGHPIISILGSKAAQNLNLSNTEIGAIVIGHGAPRQERAELILYFKRMLPTVPVVALLRMQEESLREADYNCPADNPPEWVRTVTSALGGIA